MKKTLLSNNEEKEQLSSRNMFANEEFMQEKSSVSDSTLINKIGSLSLENVDNMAMLETDSVEDEFRMENNSSRLSS